MIAHGVETDVIELDPVVYRYAKEYFYLRENHTAYLEDAVTFVKREINNQGPDRKKYEYILHDVFTGGAVPASLFTQEFFSGLRDLLADDGVIAIVSSIHSVFPNSRLQHGQWCRGKAQSVPEYPFGGEFGIGAP